MEALPDKKFEEKWLWLDPFTEDENDRAHRLQPGAVLLAEDIVEYVENYGLLFNPEEFNKLKNLKGASYSMSPHPEDAWHFVDSDSGEEGRPLLERKLTVAEDSHGKHYVVPRNSLVFIRLKEELRVPFYMIGRHNLKIRYAYRGLLLGTGPQVDPGFVQRLFIPLHNFTTEDAKVYIEESFVSIDFVRTTPLRFAPGEPVPATRDELYFKYKKDKFFLPPDKLGRTTLHDYLKGATPQSVLHEVGRNYERMKGQIEIIQGEIKQAHQQLVATGEKLVATTEAKITDFRRELGEGQHRSEEKQIELERRVEKQLGSAAKETSSWKEKLEARISEQLNEARSKLRWDVGVGIGIVLAVVGIAVSAYSLVRDVRGELPKTGVLEVQLAEIRAEQLKELNGLRMQITALEEALSKKLSSNHSSPMKAPTGEDTHSVEEDGERQSSEVSASSTTRQQPTIEPIQAPHEAASKTAGITPKHEAGAKAETPPKK